MKLKIWGVSFKGEVDFDFVNLISVIVYWWMWNYSDFDVDGSVIDWLGIVFDFGIKFF